RAGTTGHLRRLAGLHPDQRNTDGRRVRPGSCLPRTRLNMHTIVRKRYRHAPKRRTGRRLVIALAVVSAGLFLWRQTASPASAAAAPSAGQEAATDPMVKKAPPVGGEPQPAP